MELTVTVRVHECDTEAGARFDIQGVVEGNYPNEIDIPAAVDACRAAVARFSRSSPASATSSAAPWKRAATTARAASYYASAAREGYLLAITSLAGLYNARPRIVYRLLYILRRARCRPRDLRSYHEAAETGELLCVPTLWESAIATAEGVEQDYVESIRGSARQRAAATPSPTTTSARMLLNGVGVDADAQKALVLFEVVGGGQRHLRPEQPSAGCIRTAPASIRTSTRRSTTTAGPRREGAAQRADQSGGDLSGRPMASRPMRPKPSAGFPKRSATAIPGAMSISAGPIATGPASTPTAPSPPRSSPRPGGIFGP